MALWKRGGTWWADVTVNGRRYRESLKTTDKREAKSREKELVASIQAGKVGSPSGKAFARLPFDQAAEIYLAERIGRVADRTIQFERERLGPLLRFFDKMHPGKITGDTITAYQRSRLDEGLSGRTINMEVAVLSRILRKAKCWAAVEEDVKKFPEATNIGRALTASEKRRLFETASQRPGWLVAHCAAVLAASMTCRGVELRNLRWRDVDLFKRTLRVERSKNESGRRTIPLNEDAMEALARLRKRAEVLGAGEADHYVFPWCQYGRTDPTRHQQSWRKGWRNLTAEAGLNGFRFHDLRHTAITEMAEAGESDATLMAIAGHMTRRMLEHYSHVRMEAKRSAVKKLSSGLMGDRSERIPSTDHVN